MGLSTTENIRGLKAARSLAEPALRRVVVGFEPALAQVSVVSSAVQWRSAAATAMADLRLAEARRAGRAEPRPTQN